MRINADRASAEPSAARTGAGTDERRSARGDYVGPEAAMFLQLQAQAGNAAVGSLVERPQADASQPRTDAAVASQLSAAQPQPDVNTEISSGGNVEVSSGGNFRVSSGGNAEISSGGKISLNAPQIELAASSLTLAAPMVTVSGLLTAGSVATQSVAAAAYTPGVGNER